MYNVRGVLVCTAVVFEKRLSAGEIELGIGVRVTSSEGRLVVPRKNNDLHSLEQYSTVLSY